MVIFLKLVNFMLHKHIKIPYDHKFSFFFFGKGLEKIKFKAKSQLMIKALK